jgi:nicotinamidase-related amidase
MTLATPRTALVCIDLQLAIFADRAGAQQAAVDRALEELLGRIARLQAFARTRGIPVLHVQHDGERGHRLETSGPGWPFFPEVAPAGGDQVIHKRDCDAFHETGLLAALQALAVKRIAVAGCVTQFCIDTTCRRAVSLGFDVLLVADGHLNPGSGAMTFQQVIDHHNRTLDDLGAGDHVIRVVPAAGLSALV